MPAATPAKHLLHLRVFLGSPNDCGEERQEALKVLNELPYDPFVQHRVTFEALAYDHPQSGAVLLAGIPAQDSVIRSLGKPAECDIVVICLWTKLGSPMQQPAYQKPGGGYFTGTEWEYDNAVQAFRKSGRPEVLLYHRSDELVGNLSPKYKLANAERTAQMEQVEAFLQDCHTRYGSIPKSYRGASGFAEALRDDLKQIISQRLDALAPAPFQTHSVSKTESVSNPSPLWTGSPFPGLRPFTDQDSPIFFGRGRETDELLARLREPQSQRFIAVVGASGSGKSSLVWAGLIPRLMGGALEGSADWVWKRFTPGELGDNPFISLAACWKPALESSGKTVRELADDLCLAPENVDGLLSIALANRPASAELLLFIDQFEELYTVVQPDLIAAFVRCLLALSASVRVRLVLSVRADFYAQCVAQGLAEVLRTASYPLAAAESGALYAMITRPAALAGLAFEPGLDEVISSDAGHEPGALPLLAFALEQLYQARTAEGLLTHDSYKTFGKVQGAIGKQADAAFAKLPHAVQAKFTEVFRELVEVDERGEPTRRRAKLGDILHPTQTQQTDSVLKTESVLLINALTKARLLVADGDGEAATIEVAHEALFKSWRTLADWVTQTADDHRLRRQITQLAAYWDAHDRQDAHLWPDERVVEVAQMLAHLGLRMEQFSAVEQAFLGPIDSAEMLQEIELPKTSHERRAMIGVRLDRLGDTRKGVSLSKDGLPDLDWVSIPSGEVTIEIRADVNKPDSEIIKTLTREVGAFEIARFPVTVAQFQAFLRECHDGQHWHLPPGAPFDLPDSYAPPKHRARHGNHPADSVNWYDAVIFCHWLSARLGFEVRLPTEFEWQWAAVAEGVSAVGRNKPAPAGVSGELAGPMPETVAKRPYSGLPLNYPWGQEWNPEQEPWRANSYESDLGRATAVGMYPGGASSSGLLDLSGTVWEWCQNTSEDPDDVAFSTGAARVLRGGSWTDYARICRSAYRYDYQPDYRNDIMGFRCARVQS